MKSISERAVIQCNITRQAVITVSLSSVPLKTVQQAERIYRTAEKNCRIACCLDMQHLFTGAKHYLKLTQAASRRAQNMCLKIRGTRYSK